MMKSKSIHFVLFCLHAHGISLDGCLGHTFRALAIRQREIRHLISGENRVSIAIIHAVNIRETVDNEMAKRYAKSWNVVFSLLSH